eukprot:7189443-Pyramimonas_sp.AAC.1
MSTCCGTRRAPTCSGECELDQVGYIQALERMGSAELVGKSNAEFNSESLANLYLSLLTFLAFALITRVDLRVYAVALQRHAAAPKCGHMRKLNTLVRWAQAAPLRIHYPPMRCARTFEIHSGAAF